MKKRFKTPQERESAIIEARQSGQTLKEIGERFGITSSRVHQITSHAKAGRDTKTNRVSKKQIAKRFGISEDRLEIVD